MLPLRCADHYGWERTTLRQAHERIVQERFQFQFFWKKPLSSPDRRMKAQVFVDVQRHAHAYLVLFDRHLNEIRRMLFSIVLPGSGTLNAVLGRIAWDDNETVRIGHRNARDYWLLSTAGSVAFHYPRAESGDAHGEFDLGLMYFEGRQVLQDRERGLNLIESAASKGYKHAVRFLERLAHSAAGVKKAES
jgi:TPR repeat protein